MKKLKHFAGIVVRLHISATQKRESQDDSRRGHYQETAARWRSLHIVVLKSDRSHAMRVLKGRPQIKYSMKVVGARGFEPPTPCTQNRCATWLRHSPTFQSRALATSPTRVWWARQDSNPRPSRYERPALTAELQAHAFLAQNPINGVSTHENGEPCTRSSLSADRA